MSYSKLCSRNEITVSALLSSGAMNSDNARCAHIWCGWRRKDHFGIPPQFCRLRTDGTIDKREKFKEPLSKVITEQDCDDHSCADA